MRTTARAASYGLHTNRVAVITSRYRAPQVWSRDAGLFFCNEVLYRTVHGTTHACIPGGGKCNKDPKPELSNGHLIALDSDAAKCCMGVRE